MDNFKGQITLSVRNVLDENNIHICLLPPNTTDQLQPLDISVNKPAKEFLKRKFEDWYAGKVLEHIEEQDSSDDTGTIEIDMEPVGLSLPVMKELGAEWIVEMTEYIRDNPQFITNGFRRSGILGALDMIADDVDSTDKETSTDSESIFESDFTPEEYEFEGELSDLDIHTGD